MSSGSVAMREKGWIQVAAAHSANCEDSKNNETPPQKRQSEPGLRKGQIWVSPDFDDPLPDEFWLGSDA